MRTHRPLGASSGRITQLGPYFVDANGQTVIRKSLTAFTLPKRFTEHRDVEALNYLDWAAARGFNEVRIFSRVDWTGPPGSGVESGWEYDEAACDAVLKAAANRGLRVEVVAHTGPKNSVLWMAGHLREVDELCLRHENALLSVWNEPQQNGGHALVEQVLSLYTPRTSGWATGCYDPTPYTSVVVIGQTDDGRPIYAPTDGARIGQVMTLHTTRKDEWSRLFKDGYECGTGQGPSVVFTPGFAGPVMLDEPPQVEQTIRDEGHVWPAADDWRAYGAGAAFFACGATLHGNPQFQRCEIPTDPAILACVDAFIAGFGDVPVQRYHGYNRTDPPSSNPGSRRYHRWGDDSRQYVIDVRPYAFRAI